MDEENVINAPAAVNVLGAINLNLNDNAGFLHAWENNRNVALTGTLTLGENVIDFHGVRHEVQFQEHPAVYDTATFTIAPDEVVTINGEAIYGGNDGVRIFVGPRFANNGWQGFVNGLYTQEMAQDQEQFLGQFFSQITDFG